MEGSKVRLQALFLFCLIVKESKLKDLNEMSSCDCDVTTIGILSSRLGSSKQNVLLQIQITAISWFCGHSENEQKWGKKGLG